MTSSGLNRVECTPAPPGCVADFTAKRQSQRFEDLCRRPLGDYFVLESPVLESPQGCTLRICVRCCHQRSVAQRQGVNRSVRLETWS